MEVNTNPSPLLAESSFIDEEIARLKKELAELHTAYHDSCNWAHENRMKGIAFIDDSDNTLGKCRQVDRSIQTWENEKRRRERAAFIKRVTTFPEEIELSWRDLYFMSWCEDAGDWHQKHGMTKVSIVKAIKEAMQPQKNWTDELIEEEIANA